MAHAGMLGRLGRVHFGQSDHSADGSHLVTLLSRITLLMVLTERIF